MSAPNAFDLLMAKHSSKVESYSLAIVGGRTFTDKAAFDAIMTDFISKRGGCMPSRVVSGGANGVDSLAREWALSHGVAVVQYLPDWNKHGRAAGIMRNKDIIDASDVVLALPTPSSRGTHDSIKRARKQAKELVVIDVPET